MPGEPGGRHEREHPPGEPVAERADPGGCLGALGLGTLERHGEADGAGDVLGAAAAVAFLTAAVEHRFEGEPRPHREHADPGGRAELVARDRESVGAGAAQRQPARRLHRVEVQRHARGGGDRRQCRHVLHGADLVVGVADAHDRRLGADRRGEIVR